MSCWKGGGWLVMEDGGKREEGGVPVCFVEDYELLPTRGEGDFLLGETFDPVADDVDACSCGVKPRPVMRDVGLAYPARRWR